MFVAQAEIVCVPLSIGTVELAPLEKSGGVFSVGAVTSNALEIPCGAAVAFAVSCASATSRMLTEPVHMPSTSTASTGRVASDTPPMISPEFCAPRGEGVAASDQFAAELVSVELVRNSELPESGIAAPPPIHCEPSV